MGIIIFCGVLGFLGALIYKWADGTIAYNQEIRRHQAQEIREKKPMTEYERQAFHKLWIDHGLDKVIFSEKEVENILELIKKTGMR